MFEAQAGRLIGLTVLAYVLPLAVGNWLIYLPMALGQVRVNRQDFAYLGIHYGYMIFYYVMGTYSFCTLGQTLFDPWTGVRRPVGRLIWEGAINTARSLWLVLPLALLDHILYGIQPWLTQPIAFLTTPFFQSWLMARRPLFASIDDSWRLLRHNTLKSAAAFLPIAVFAVVSGIAITAIGDHLPRPLPFPLSVTWAAPILGSLELIFAVWTISWYAMVYERTFADPSSKVVAAVFE